MAAVRRCRAVPADCRVERRQPDARPGQQDAPQEIAIRLSIRASRGQLVGELMIESIVLALIGGAGDALAVGGVAILRWIAPAELARVADGRFEPAQRARVHAAGVRAQRGSLSASFLHSAASAWEPGRWLKEGSRGGESRRQGRARAVLVAGQVTLSVVPSSGTCGSWSA